MIINNFLKLFLALKIRYFFSFLSREREERKLRSLQRKQVSGEGNYTEADGGPRSAPARLNNDPLPPQAYKPASPLSLANHLGTTASKQKNSFVLGSTIQ